MICAATTSRLMLPSTRTTTCGSQALGEQPARSGSDGVVYPSVRYPGGECVGLFYPDLASEPVQGRHLDYHWDGERVDLYREAGRGTVYRIA